jgi:predicted Zn-dependent peptidase
MTLPSRLAAFAAFAASGLLSLAPTARAQEPKPVSIESFTLPNGLKVHLAPDNSSQVVAVNVWYDVGSRNEVAGRTGFAHLFEHMMFQGSQNVGKAEHGNLVERAGGQLNGSTQPDRTNYYNEIPSNRLNLALWLEADRMRSLVISAENLKNQQEAVKEERRLRFDNQPYVGTLVDSLPTLFDPANCYAYSHSIIGSMDDLNAATVEDVQAFFDLYYTPNNATLVIAGDFQTAEARRMVQQYFGAIPRGQTPPPVPCAPQGSTGREVVRRVVDKNATLPAALTAYRTVGVAHRDHPALELLSTILGAGESSRLNRSLVRDSKVAVAAQAVFNPFGPMRGVGIFGVLAIANQGVPVDTVQAQLLRQVSSSADAITQDELTKAKNAWRAGTIFSRQQAINVSEAIHYAALYLGDPQAVNTDAARYDAVTLADLRRVARSYLRPENSLTLQIVPEGSR